MADRPFVLTTALAQDEVNFVRLQGTERISACFEFFVTFEHVSPNIDLDALLGTVATVEMPEPDGPGSASRFFSGIVTAAYFDGNDRSDLFSYRLHLRPALWQLSTDTDNRIFQNLSAPDIVAQVLSDAGMGDFDLSLTGSYPVRDYCVQYNETTLNFVQRLLEHEGIFYFFTFDDGRHTMHLVDSIGDCEDAPDQTVLEFYAASETPDAIGIRSLRRGDRVVTGQVQHTDYDFTKPSSDLVARTSDPLASAGSEVALLDDDGMEYTLSRGETTLLQTATYEYPGHYTDHGRGRDLSTVRSQETRARSQMRHALSTAAQPGAGFIIDIEDFPREAENQEYLIVEARYDMGETSYYANIQDPPENGFGAEYDLMPTTLTFRPERRAPRPVMRGPQTAQVVGPGGEEIFTDEYSRVKVQFHWDRHGARDENASCWVRVSSAWAGSGWGFIQIPRIGQEVIVDFLEGDPDQPIVTGRVYNAEQMPPYDLPANATQSGWKSNSSKGGGGFNELRFEDLAGSEEVYFQAQKDHTELIKNDEARTIGHDFSEEVGNDATQDIGHDRTETVGNDKRTRVDGHRTVNIGKNDTEEVGANRQLTVHGSETIHIDGDSDEQIWRSHSQYVLLKQKITVAGTRTDKVGGMESRAVGGMQGTTVAGARTVTVGKVQTHKVSGDDKWIINGGREVAIGKDETYKVAGDQSVWVDGDGTYMVTKKAFHSSEDDATFRSNKSLVLEAEDQITIRVGKASIMMKKDGTITVSGKDLSLDGSGKINIKADGDVITKGAKVHHN